MYGYQMKNIGIAIGPIVRISTSAIDLFLFFFSTVLIYLCFSDSISLLFEFFAFFIFFCLFSFLSVVLNHQ
jgi:hypothetical protein